VIIGKNRNKYCVRLNYIVFLHEFSSFSIAATGCRRHILADSCTTIEGEEWLAVQSIAASCQYTLWAEIVGSLEFSKINKVFILYMQKDSAFFSLHPSHSLSPCPAI
jgi:energy-converting hydrogenase Eha subunit G